jgi:hypothetical protein
MNALVLLGRHESMSGAVIDLVAACFLTQARCSVWNSRAEKGMKKL